MYRCELVPEAFFKAPGKEEKVFWKRIPSLDAVLLYEADSEESLPELYYILDKLDSNPEYNKVHLSFKDGCLHLAIAQGRNLLLANVYEAPDFTTAEYYLFLALRQLQLNPEITTVCVASELSEEEEMSLYRYFKAVERI